MCTKHAEGVHGVDFCTLLITAYISRCSSSDTSDSGAFSRLVLKFVVLATSDKLILEQVQNLSVFLDVNMQKPQSHIHINKKVIKDEPFLLLFLVFPAARANTAL